MPETTCQHYPSGRPADDGPCPHCIEREQLQRIARAFYQMPYAGVSLLQPSSSTGYVLTLDDIAHNLETLAGILADHAAADHARDAETDRYRRLINSGRDLLALLTEADAR